ncbi:MAG: orotate phosphoribosyltransferase [Lachnospiraceae bacterium]|nr:orotate phosphoribosyltransferase [Lachnospiraceae bacterium]
MKEYQEEFIDFMLEGEVLRFGDFTTKSGRKTPFFINAGLYKTGEQLKRLGEYYAKTIHDEFGEDIDILFGPAYKGIPLSVATCIALYEMYGMNVSYCANRKEIKDHGEKGILLGSPIKDGDKVVIIEDVTTAGTSIRETMPIIKAQADCDVVGLVVSVDRMEKGTGELNALDEIAKNYNFKTTSIVNMEEVVERLRKVPYNGKILIDSELESRISAYYDQYGAESRK